MFAVRANSIQHFLSLAQATSNILLGVTFIIMASTAVLQGGLCAHCNKHTTNVCTGGNWTPDSREVEAAKTYYCNGACQQEDWTTHKAACKAIQERIPLYRGGLTIQTLFYKFRERLFDQLIVKAERKGDVLYLHKESCNSILAPFASGLFADELERKAVLVHLACSDFTAYMYEVIKAMLKGNQEPMG